MEEATRGLGMGCAAMPAMPFEARRMLHASGPHATSRPGHGTETRANPADLPARSGSPTAEQPEYGFGDLQLTRSAVSQKPVALCDGHGALPVAASGMLVAARTGRWRGPTQNRAAEESGMLTEPCRGVFMQSGRWIFI